MTFPGNLTRDFPNLTSSNSRKTSDATWDYNCIAWAAGDTSQPWWPDAGGDGYWPEGVPREETVDAFIAAYQSIGYTSCANGDCEDGVEKIAIYANANGRPTHAARQLPNGKWTSKLGQLQDIEHESLTDLADSDYGIAIRFLERPRVEARKED